MNINIKNNFFILGIGFFILTIFGRCAADSDGTAPVLDLPTLSVAPLAINETNANFLDSIEITLTGDYAGNSVVNWTIVSESAVLDLDFKVITEGRLVFSPTRKTNYIIIECVGDEIAELKETFKIRFYNPINLVLKDSELEVSIQDDDNNTDGLQIPTTGYVTPLSYPGYKMVWSDEFDSTALNTKNWTPELGTGNNGWGNNELQYYRAENTSFLDGNLVITAKKQKFGSSEYTSSRLVTQNKKAFKFGRVDIRAVLPKGRGLWPALWMLGSNISSVGWPSCGEIDIMELTGDIPDRVLSTLHYGNSTAEREYKSKALYLPNNKTFFDEYHVFSLLWKENEMQFLVDDVPFYTFTPSDTGNAPYPFNRNFFFIFNVAVGGQLPGNPDATTSFPQSMIVDYVRVFQVQ